MQRTRERAWLCFGLLAALGCRSSPDADVFKSDVPLHPVSQAPAVLSLHVSPGLRIPGRAEDSERLPLVVALWSDGTIAWSAHPASGGAPYLVSHLSPEVRTSLVGRLRSQLARPPAWGRAYGVPDSSAKILTLFEDGNLTGLDSCIEEIESDGRLVVTDKGVESLDGRSRDEVVSRLSPELREFREVWRRCVDPLLASIPTSGEIEMPDWKRFDYVHWEPLTLACGHR